jgi:ABC-type spermidine/putrescine transport system permease subunit II
VRRGLNLVDALSGLLALLAALAIYAPLAVVCVFSLWPAERVRGALALKPLTAESYSALMGNKEILEALSRSLSIGAVATLICVAAGFLFALYHARTDGLSRKIMQAIIFLPLLFPPIVTGLALLISFRQLDIARGFLTIVSGHVILILPIAYRTILVRLESLKPSLIEASLDLGASQVQTYRHVLWPHLRTAIVSAALLSFVLSFDETLVTLFLSGSEMTLPIRLWAMVRLGFVPEVNALAALILVAAAAVTVSVAVLQRDRG